MPRSTSGRSPIRSTSGTPPAAYEIPPGTVAGARPRDRRLPASLPEAGVGQIQVRFPARTAEELCDQIAAFGADVIPLVNG